MSKKIPSTAPRKPPPVDARAADAFVAQTSSAHERSNVQTSERPRVRASKRVDASTSERPGDSVRVTRKDGRALRRKTLYLPQDLAVRLAVYCAQNDTTESDAIALAVTRLLEGGR